MSLGVPFSVMLGVSGVPSTLRLFYLPVFLCRISGEIEKQVGHVKAAALVCPCMLSKKPTFSPSRVYA